MYERRGHLKRPIAGVTLRRAHVPQQSGLRRGAGARAARGAARAAGELQALRLAPHPLLRRFIFLSSAGAAHGPRFWQRKIRTQFSAPLQKFIIYVPR